ncbi:hypothetical protein QBC34DRAFT_434031 [Podospora aff. communis PSN243]|uniref:DOMON domain-containing protein n=1 Tax=Podospora aff. communis PSN243 TaxID=3040156 RepID=A0AAV9H283_9PEZI|nr:hypothetical protein QBC34DRAFT_434031 [Podospora aff. communis PSN243]
MKLLGLLLWLTQLQTALAAASTLRIGDSNTTISINIPPNSDDVNFYISTPDYYQYTAIGFGTLMSTSLLLIAYPSTNGSITLSPRFATAGYSEPTYNPSIRFTIHPPSGIHAHEMLINATCHTCRTHFDPLSPSQPMIFASGPPSHLASDDPSAPLRRHVVHGRFTVDLPRATGAGGIPFPSTGTEGAVLTGSVVATPRSKQSLAHGIVFAVATLVIAPADMIVAGALRRWPVLHSVSATVYVALAVGALVPGIAISREHFATRDYKTGHQVLGLIGVAVLFGMFLWGAGMGFARAAAKKRGEVVNKGDSIWGKVHRWVGRGLWILFIVDGGLGLRLAERSNLFMMGYGVLVGVVFLVGLPIWFLIWRCSKYQREKEVEEENHELQQQQYNIYNHSHNNY